MTRRRSTALVLLLGLGAWGPYIGACSPCPSIDDALPSGDYVVTDVSGDPGAQWQSLEGARVHVDREERIMTIRYTRDGTTYEVRYEII